MYINPVRQRLVHLPTGLKTLHFVHTVFLFILILATGSYYFPTQDLRTCLSNASTLCFL
jgi:hypothetical protein